MFKHVFSLDIYLYEIFESVFVRIYEVITKIA